MPRPGVLVATVALLAGCGRDPILEAAERADAEKAAAAEKQASPSGTPGEAGSAGRSTAVRAVPSRLPGAAADGSAPVGSPTPVGPGAPTPAPAGAPNAAILGATSDGGATPSGRPSAARKVPSTLFDAPVAPGGGAGVPEEPTPGRPGEPPPGVGASPTPVQVQPVAKGVPGAPTPVRPPDPLPGRPREPSPAIPGAPPPTAGPMVEVSGTVVFAEWTRGKVRVTAFDADHQAHPKTPPHVVGGAEILRPGGFSVRVPQGSGKVYLEATVDEDADGRPGRLEPVGVADRYPVTVATSDVSGVVVEVKRVTPPPGGVGEDL